MATNFNIKKPLARKPNTERVEQFYAVYLPELVKDVSTKTEQYRWPVENAPEVARKMTNSLALGTAGLSNAVKRAAKVLGVKPTQTAISQWLCEAEQKD